MTDVQRQKKKKNKTTISFYDANFLSFIALKKYNKKNRIVQKLRYIIQKKGKKNNLFSGTIINSQST